MPKQFLWDAQPLGPDQQQNLRDQEKYLSNVEKAINQERLRLALQIQQGKANAAAVLQQGKELNSLEKTIEREKLKLKLKQDMVKAGVGVATAEQQYQQELDKTIKRMEQAARLKKDLIKAGYIEGAPSSPGPWAALGGMKASMGGSAGLANLAFWSKVGDVLGQRIQAHIPGQTLAEYNLQPGTRGLNPLALQQRQFEAGAGDIRSMITMGGLTDFFMPSLGRTYDQLAGAYRMNQPFFMQQQALESQRSAVELAAAREPMVTARRRQRMELEREKTRFGALAKFGMSSAAPQAQAYLGGQAALMQFQAVGAAQAGYARGEAMHDFAGAIGHAVSKAQMEMEQRRQENILGAERATAQKHLTAAEKELAGARAPLGQLEMQLAAAQDDPAKDRARLALKQQYIQITEREKVLDEAMRASKEQEVRQAEMLNQHSQQRLSLLQQESSRLQGIVREEKEREVSRKSAFGLTHPMRQRTALGIAMKMRQGRPLTQHEIQFAGSMPEIFGHRLQQLGEQRAGQFGFYQQIRQMFPELGERQRQAEQQLGRINQQFQVAIQFDPQQTAAQITEKVMPFIRQAMAEVEVRIREDLNRLGNAQWLGRQPLMGR